MTDKHAFAFCAGSALSVYSLGHLGTCKCSNVTCKTNLSWTYLISGLLSFDYPSVLLFSLSTDGNSEFGSARNLLACNSFNGKTWIFNLRTAWQILGKLNIFDVLVQVVNKSCYFFLINQSKICSNSWINILNKYFCSKFKYPILILDGY